MVARTTLRAKAAVRRTPPFRIERGGPRDMDLLLRHRYQMFVSMGRFPRKHIVDHLRLYRTWIRPRLRSGEVLALVARDAKGRALGSGCVWFRPELPRPGGQKPRVPYVLSMYTERRFRGRGVASAIVRRVIAIARARGYPRVFLHATRMGRPVYERLGFEATREMRLELDGSRTRDREPGHRPRRRPKR